MDFHVAIAPSRLRVCDWCCVRRVPCRASTPQSITVTTATVSIPSELAPAVAQALASDVVTVTTGTTKLEFWWVKSLPLREGATGAPSWADVPDGSLVGALRLGASWSDIRGFTVRPGVYTLRFALQPQNGDHLGISPNREFLLPAPAADDLTPAPVGYERRRGPGQEDVAPRAPRLDQHRPARQLGTAPVGRDQRPGTPDRHRGHPYVGRRAHLRRRRRRHYRTLATARSERIRHRGTECTEGWSGWLNYRMDLSGRGVLITGGKRIGAAVAIDLARAGADIALVYNHSLAEAEATATEVRAAGRRAAVIRGDLSKADDCRRVVDEGPRHWAAWTSW